MPFLMVNLDDPSDCQRAVMQLRRRLRRIQANDGCGAGKPAPRGRGKRRHFDGEGSPRPGGARGPKRPDRGRREPIDPKATLKQRLLRIQRRGVWRFLSQIAQLDDTARSLAELDAVMDLPRNKMRSTKAIFAKLEKRLDVDFLVLDEDAGNDEAGNPRYVMPKRVRKQILKLI